MANENIKIVVQEHDVTRPKGSGVSSDIVYVPGLATPLCPQENRNKPILCNSVEEFEAYFGSTPYRFTGDEFWNACKVAKGTYDKSYIYAKELLTAGLSVLYENISREEQQSKNLLYSFASTMIPKDTIGNIFNCSKNFTNATITFNLSDIPMDVNCVQLFVTSETNELSVTLNSLTPQSGNFAVTEVKASSDADAETVSYKISWDSTAVTYADKLSTIFTLSVSTKGTGKFKVEVVEGNAEADPMTSITSTIDNRTALAYFYAKLPDCFENLEDKNEYTVKYLTTGGYPSFVAVTADGKTDYPIAAKMLATATARNDVVALIDHVDNPASELSTTAEDGIYQEVNDYFKNAANTEFGAMFTPWGDYSCSTVAEYDLGATLQAMPASFGYLLCLAKAIKTSPNWLAMAGVTRGIVPNLQRLRTNKVLSNVIAENYQPKFGDVGGNNVISMNAITDVKPYGLTIWGNRTLKRVAANGTVATSFLNTRNMISDIKKLAYNTAKSLMFEQESDSLWLSFKSGVSPLLDQLKSGNGISDYKLIKNTTKYTGGALTRGEMSCVIKIFPLYAVEYFEITVVVADNDVAVS